MSQQTTMATWGAVAALLGVLVLGGCDDKPVMPPDDASDAQGVDATAATDALLADAPDVDSTLADAPDAVATIDVTATADAQQTDVKPVADASVFDAPPPDAQATDTPDVQAKADATPVVDAQPPDIVNPCSDPPAPSVKPSPPMAYAPASNWQAGQLSCGTVPAPYFWASADLPAPVACTTTCAASPHAESTLCAGGQCLVARCAPGWQDRDAWAGNGCEVDVPVTCDLFVEATAASAAVQDGSVAHPFGGLGSALCASKAGCVVHLGAGDYQVPSGANGATATLKGGVVLRGAGPNATRIIGYQNAAPIPGGKAPAITIGTDDVVLEGLAVVGGLKRSIAVTGKRALLRHIAVGPVDVDDDFWTKKKPAVGIDLQGSIDARLTLTWVHDVGNVLTVAEGPTSGRGISGGSGVRVFGARVEAIHGQNGCDYTDPSFYYTLPGCYPSKGGDAVGIDVEGIVSGSAVLQVKPGRGGVGGGYNVSGYVSAGGDVAPQGEWVLIHATQVDATNSVDGDPVLALSGCAGGTVSGFTIKASTPSITIKDSSDVVVSGNTLVGSTIYDYWSLGEWFQPAIGLAGCKNCTVSGNSVKNSLVPAIQVDNSPQVLVSSNVVEAVASLAPQTEVKAGMRIGSSTGCTVSNNTISDVQSNSPYLGKGYDADGLRVEGSAGCTVSGNQISKVVGGVGIAVDFTAAPGGDATGVRVVNCPSAVVDGNQFTGIQGGSAGYYTTTINWNYPGGDAIGVAVLGSPGAIVSHHAIADIKPGASKAGEPTQPIPQGNTTCVDIHGGAAVDHLTCAGVSRGIHAVGGGTVSVSNSIFSKVGTCAVTDSLPLTLTMAWTDLWPVATCAVATLGAGMLSVDPVLGSDLKLGPTSAAIDAGDPAAPYCAEPKPNGCRTDLGAFGNTANATPLPGAKTCACP